MGVAVLEVTRERLAGLEVLASATGRHMAGLSAPSTRWWLAQIGDRPVGMIGAEIADGLALVRTASVLPWLQRRGIGSALLGHALGALGERGCTRAYCFSTRSSDFFARHGFVEIPARDIVRLFCDSPQVRELRTKGRLDIERGWVRSLP